MAQNNNSTLIVLGGDLTTPFRILQGSALMLNLLSDKSFTSQCLSWTFTPDSGIGLITFGTKGELVVSAPDAASSPLTINGNTSSFVISQTGSVTMAGSSGLFLNINSVSGMLKINGTQVVAARITGWADPTNTMSRATFDTTTVTTAQLAQRVGQMILDIKTHGMFGT